MRDASFAAFTTAAKYAPERPLLDSLIEQAGLDAATRRRIEARAVDLVRRIRAGARPSLIEQFLSEYGLSTREGIALMCLAEAMLRVPDPATIDALIEDKIAPSDWGRHLGQASSPLVNASTWALMLTGRVLDVPEPGLAGTLRGMVRRLGEPVIRRAVAQAMKELGRQFVLGETIDRAMERARAEEAKGYGFSYDMLGEAAMTRADADRYARAYAGAIDAIAAACTSERVRDNPGISVKLSALHPRYEVAQEDRVLAELVPVLAELARKAAAAGMGLNVDAEEQDRLVLSLKVIERVLADPALAGWDGFGVVVQAYGKRAGAVLDWLHDTARRLDRRIMVRLVKGAYWDTEMKLAQVAGAPDFPLFTTKPATDVSYLAMVRRLFSMADRIYPQFATHNAHTVAAVLEMAPRDAVFEFQRLHGMGERLHDLVLAEGRAGCRIYAPVGRHRDLLAYLVRRLLENGANSSFVHQIVDESVPPEAIARDPVEAACSATPPAGLRPPARIFGTRTNSRGFDLADDQTLARIEAARAVALEHALADRGRSDPDGRAGGRQGGGRAHARDAAQPGQDRHDPLQNALEDAEPLTVAPAAGPWHDVTNPATGRAIGRVRHADAATVAAAIAAARLWDAPAGERARILDQAARAYEDHFGPFFATIAQEAGKTLPDCVAELREAVDFLRYYAEQAVALPDALPLGVVTAISPWNFPLAIFTGQVAAALAAGNAVLAKPAEQTPLTAALAVRLLHRAGVPRSALQLLPGDGPVVGRALTADSRIDGVLFTGSTETAQAIRRVMADHLAPGAPLIAETGGLNAMIVDSTALHEQAVRAIVSSAFQSAGQRCSALRCLYVQEDVADDLLTMLKGAMDMLRIGDPWLPSTDVGPLIDAAAHAEIAAHVARARAEGRVLHELPAPGLGGHFQPPVLIRVRGIEELEREIFGPVLHVATFPAEALERVIAAINASGYGLTFGLHSRIDARVQQVAEAVRAGNLYVNRNQIGAVVGSQPFGGEGLSGTGPKAGGPHYLPRLTRREVAAFAAADPRPPVTRAALQARLDAVTPRPVPVGQSLLPGPTGEMNRLMLFQRTPLLCLGPGAEAEHEQRRAVEALGGTAVAAGGPVAPEMLTTLRGFSGALWWGDAETGRAFARALAAREGPILPLVTGRPDTAHALHERHLCVDTTAAGGNAALLAGAPAPDG